MPHVQVPTPASLPFSVTPVEGGTRFRQTFADGIKHPVYKLHRVWPGKPPRDLQSFIDYHGSRSTRLVNQLKQGEAQNVPVYSRHAFEAPVLGVVAQVSVQGFDLSCRACKEGFSESMHVHIKLLICQKRPDDVFGGVPSHVPLEEHLQGKFARFSS